MKLQIREHKKNNFKIKSIELFLIVLSIAIFSISNANAQVSVNINLGTPPIWAPADRVAVQYYYLPDIDVYYDVPQQQYIYVSNRNWIRSNSLPSRYRNYNLRGGHVVYLNDYRGNSPYMYHKNHRVKYYHHDNGQKNYKGDGGHKERGNGKGKHNKG